jgi:hypothetical protein
MGLEGNLHVQPWRGRWTPWMLDPALATLPEWQTVYPITAPWASTF